MIEDILAKAGSGALLERQDALRLLEVATGSAEYYALLGAANAYARTAFRGRGVIFAQIGIDAQACGVNCKFCSLAADARRGQPACIKTLEETVELARELAASGIEDLFLMTTAEFPQEKFLAYGRAVHAVLPPQMRPGFSYPRIHFLICLQKMHWKSEFQS